MRDFQVKQSPSDYLKSPTTISFFLEAIEYVPANKRSVIGNFGFAVGFTAAGMILPWIILWVGDWKIFHLVIYLQMSVIFITPW